jgi:hypothetical protein
MRSFLVVILTIDYSRPLSDVSGGSVMQVPCTLVNPATIPLLRLSPIMNLRALHAMYMLRAAPIYTIQPNAIFDCPARSESSRNSATTLPTCQ